MAYTPINWQTGDTITAEKLNKMDRGWAVESTSQQLFSETVTTTDHDGIYGAILAYSGTIDAAIINVTFDGTEYTCPSIGDGMYGAPWSDDLNAYDFSEFPFNLFNNDSAVYLTTQTAGTHTITVTATVTTMQTSADFAAAVSSVVLPSLPTFQIKQYQTTWQQVHDAMVAGKIAYFYSGTDSNAGTYFAESADFDTATNRYSVSCNGGNITLSASTANDPLQSD